LIPRDFLNCGEEEDKGKEKAKPFVRSDIWTERGEGREAKKQGLDLSAFRGGRLGGGKYSKLSRFLHGTKKHGRTACRRRKSKKKGVAGKKRRRGGWKAGQSHRERSPGPRNFEKRGQTPGPAQVGKSKTHPAEIQKTKDWGTKK